MQFTEAVAAIKRIPLFAGFDASTLKLLAFSSSYVTLRPGEVLFRQGDPSDSVYLVDDGEVDVIGYHDGQEVIIARLGRHQLLGEMGVFRHGPRTATLRAAAESKLLRFEADIFLQLVTGNADAALAVMRNLCDKLALSTEALEKLNRGGPASAPVIEG